MTLTIRDPIDQSGPEGNNGIVKMSTELFEELVAAWAIACNYEVELTWGEPVVRADGTSLYTPVVARKELL